MEEGMDLDFWIDDDLSSSLFALFTSVINQSIRTVDLFVNCKEDEWNEALAILNLTFESIELELEWLLFKVFIKSSDVEIE